MGGCGCCSRAMGERVSWYCAVVVTMMLVLSSCESISMNRVQGKNRACEEIYVVREGETLQTIGEKCGDPFILEDNPHIHDPDDLFPGLVIKINPFSIHQF